LKGLINNNGNQVEKEVQEKVKNLCANFPIYNF
jgi:glycine/serine hydroxymethyltransferase